MTPAAVSKVRQQPRITWLLTISYIHLVNQTVQQRDQVCITNRRELTSFTTPFTSSLRILTAGSIRQEPVQKKNLFFVEKFELQKPEFQ